MMRKGILFIIIFVGCWGTEQTYAQEPSLGPKKPETASQPDSIDRIKSSLSEDSARAEGIRIENRKNISNTYYEKQKIYKDCLKGKKFSECKDKKEEFNQASENYFNEYHRYPGTLESEECDNLNDEYTDKFKDCRNTFETMSEKCSSKSDSELIDSSTLNQVSPFLSMISGADAMLDVYTAMNDKPNCHLSKSDFLDEKRTLNEEVKDIENKLKENRDAAQKAQEDFADKLKGWAEQEKKISDRMTEIPIEREKKLSEIDQQKLKAKAEADSKYIAVTEQILEIKRKYSELIDTQTVAMNDTSDFAISDKCLSEIANKEIAKNKTNTNTNNGKIVAGIMSGAFLLGKNAKDYKQKSYDLCMSRERKNAVRIKNSFINELNSMKHKMETLDNVLGQIQDEKKNLDAEVARQIAHLSTSYDNEVKSLSIEYQQIQRDKMTQQGLLKQRLDSLSQETAQLQRKVSIVKLKLQHFNSKSTPLDSEKSVSKQISDCSQLDNFKKDFLETCCDGSYRGKGKSLCNSFKPKEQPVKRSRPTRNSDTKKEG